MTGTTWDEPQGRESATAAPAPDPTAAERGKHRPLRPRGDAAGLLLGLLGGVAMAILPHLLWWSRLGSPAWIADGDDALYAAIGARAYHQGTWQLVDPVPIEARSYYYPDLVLMPGVILARVLHLDPIHLLLVWRLWAGLTMSAGLYLVIRSFVRRPATAAALTLVGLADPGFFYGKPFLGMAQEWIALIGGGGYVRPRILAHWRIMPGMILGFLLFHAWLIDRARARPETRRLLAAALGFGLLFHIYFYYWTAAALALLIGLAIDRRGRSTYATSLALGGLIGLPAIWSGYQLKQQASPDWPPRFDRFIRVGRFREWLFPRAGMVMTPVAIAWEWVERRGLIYLLILTAAGLFLTNHQAVTGIVLENYHWIYAWGPCLSVALLVLALGRPLDRLAGQPRAPIAIAVLASLYLALGLATRALESTRPDEVRLYNIGYALYRGQRLAPGTPRLVPNSVLAGPKVFSEYATIEEDQRPLTHYPVKLSPWISNREWEERMALNAFLEGEDRATFEAAMRRMLANDQWGPWARDRNPSLRPVRLAERLRYYDRIERDPEESLARYHVRYLALPTGTPLPPGRGRGWVRIQSGPTWDLWERRPTPSPA